MRTNVTIISFASVVFILSFAQPSIAFETAPRISDREIVERLTRLEEGQKAILREMDKRFEAMDRRFEAIDKRFDAIDKRFESIDSRFGSIDSRFGSIDSQFDRINSQFDRLTKIMLAIFGSFVALVGCIIWFALWDRRSMVRPFETKINELEADITANSTKVHSIIDAFRALSKTDEQVASILKRFNLF